MMSIAPPALFLDLLPYPTPPPNIAPKRAYRIRKLATIEKRLARVKTRTSLLLM
jgi:hypothetical protein